jgi:hypothetical protein
MGDGGSDAWMEAAAAAGKEAVTCSVMDGRRGEWRRRHAGRRRRPSRRMEPAPLEMVACGRRTVGGGGALHRGRPSLGKEAAAHSVEAGPHGERRQRRST